MLHLDVDTLEAPHPHPEAGLRYKVGEAARRIAGEHDDPALVGRFIREQIANNLVFTRARHGTGRNAAHLLAPSDATVAWLLRVLSAGYGVQCPRTARLVSDACYGECAPGLSNISYALRLYRQQPEPEFVNFRLDSYALPGGERDLFACLYSDAHPIPDPDPARIPRSALLEGSLAVPLWAIFSAVLGPDPARGLH